MRCANVVRTRTTELDSAHTHDASTCPNKGCAASTGYGEEDRDEQGTSWEELWPELDTDDEPFDPLPEFGEPPAWADLDDWENEDD